MHHSIATARATSARVLRSSPTTPFDAAGDPAGRVPMRLAGWAVSILGAVALAGCGNSGSDVSNVPQNASGQIVPHPNPGAGSQTFVVDPNQGGNASLLKLVTLKWGRLVDVRDSAGTLQNTDFVVGENIRTDNIDYVLETNAVTSETTVTILHPVGTPAYEAAFRNLDRQLTPIAKKSLDPGEIPPFSLTARNSALVLQFDDLLDPNTIRPQTIRLLTGNPPIVPFTNVRVLPDNNHGDVIGAAGAQSFRTTRVIIDTTVSEIEAQQSVVPLQTNALGLPPSATAAQANLALRIPTRKVLPADLLLTNLAGRALSFTTPENKPGDSASASKDILRAFRSGGENDSSNGFLLDLDPPRIIGAQPARLDSAVPLGNSEFEVDLRFDHVVCALTPKVGDVIQQQTTFATVIQAPISPPAGGVVLNLRTRVIFPLGGSLLTGAVQFRSSFDPVGNFGKEDCFVRFSPTPLVPPAQGVLTGASIVLSFSEPMDPDSLSPFDGFTVTRVATNAAATDVVVARVNRTGDLKQFTFVPLLPFEKPASATQDYFINLASGTDGPTDLAGNALEDELPQIEFELEPTQPAESTAGFVFRFDSTDEFPDANQSPEIRGQYLIDTDKGVIKPRPVTHFTAVADRTRPVPSNMNPSLGAVQTPLSALGSKLQTVWRHVDVGFGLIDENNVNVDVEGLWWTPRNGAVFQEVFEQFEIALAHSKYLPDEDVDSTLFPKYPQSGLIATYINNLLSPTEDPLTVVHPRDRGYLVNPSELDLASTGTQVVPFPMNRAGLPKSQFKFKTWRDTSIQAVGGPSGNGADPDIFFTANGLPLMPKAFAAGAIPTIGLPLLMEFRCYPTNEAIGQNGFDTNFAVASSPRPNFRAFSTGGVDSSNTTQIKNPDAQTVADGGFNPNAGGAQTPAADNTFYLGQMDLVTRVSRVHTIWVDTGSASPTYAQPVIEPRPEDQPQGTQVLVAFRGATQVAASELRENSCFIDAYGNPRDCNSPPPGTPPQPPLYLNADETWKSDIAGIQGAGFVQSRVTFVSNAETNLTPAMSSLGIAYRR